ncbi:hypothetical protein ACFPYI_00605 [Halomarina salina]|uniref:DUF1102 domain-containing protein n=1 Tax=Halomarina salina TaxID=1872699 RepID=A0ABD5RHQ7_9EURY|nr:hypothetical protein [Halomarina salina]
MRPRAYQVLLVLAAVCLVAGSGAFSSVSADRGVSVSVVDDSEAYLAVDIPEQVTVTGGEKVDGTGTTVENQGQSNATNATNANESGLRRSEVTLLTVRNNFDAGVDVSVDFQGDRRGTFPELSGAHWSFSLDPGDSEPVTVDATCPGDGMQSRTVVLEIVAVGSGERVEMTREVAVACE